MAVNRDKSWDAIIVGSGVAGLSTAMEFGLRGHRTLVLERRGLASGSTSRAAGLLGQMRTTVDAVRMLMDSVRILHGIEDRSGINVFHQTGSIRIAQNAARVDELRRDVGVSLAAGLTVHTIESAEVLRLAPYVRVDDVIEACYCPSDGYLDPPTLARAYIQVARGIGVSFVEHAPVERIHSNGETVSGVRACGVDYFAPVVVNAAGPWAHLVSNFADQMLPTAGIAHYYLTTRECDQVDISPDTPTLRDRENRIYSRPCDGGLRVGIYETRPETIAVERLPVDYSMDGMTAARDHPTVRSLMDAAARRFPRITTDTPMEIRGGIMAFTPDGGPLLGEFPQLKGFFHCAGFCGHGVTQSPALGPLMADLVFDGVRRYDAAQLEADRFADFPDLQTREAVEAKCAACYANYYGKSEQST
ncbi:MAG: hypothetical protein AMXMBFR4_18080 [Candidatus Hydrogenedentota bacterium]